MTKHVGARTSSADATTSAAVSPYFSGGVESRCSDDGAACPNTVRTLMQRIYRKLGGIQPCGAGTRGDAWLGAALWRPGAGADVVGIGSHEGGGSRQPVEGHHIDPGAGCSNTRLRSR
jgi:hypothetical protein